MLRLDRVMEDSFTQCVLLPSAQQVCCTLWQDDGAFSFSSFGFAGAVFSLTLIVEGSGDFQRTFFFIEVLPLQSAYLAAAQSGGQLRVEEIIPRPSFLSLIYIRCTSVVVICEMRL